MGLALKDHILLEWLLQDQQTWERRLWDDLLAQVQTIEERVLEMTEKRRSLKERLSSLRTAEARRIKEQEMVQLLRQQLLIVQEMLLRDSRTLLLMLEEMRTLNRAL